MKSIFNYIMPKGYELSLVICGNKLARRLNKENRGKDYSANVLSFSLDSKMGEVFINIHKAKGGLISLYVHALAHLRDFNHGPTMDRLEARVLKKFNLN